MLNNIQLPAAPNWLIDELTATKHSAANSNGAPNGFMKEGRRNNDLTSLGGYYRRRGCTAEQIFDYLQSANLSSRNPVDAGEVATIASSVSRNYSQDAKGEMLDLPMSRMIAEAVSHFCRYVPETGWRVYNGRSWVIDPTGILAKEHIKCQLEAFFEAIKASSDADTIREARKYLSNSKVNAVSTLVMSDPSIKAATTDFDNRPSLLNLQNGTLDLSTGNLMPHDPRDLLSKIANVSYDNSAECPNFRRTLATSLPQSLRLFLLRYLGYALLGIPNEQVFAILYGSGANGKSALINPISYLLGEYAATVEPSSLIRQKGDKIRGDIARLQGVHFAVTSELAKAEILDAALVKRVTGGDTITARALYAGEIEYKPKFVLIMATNALAVIDGADPALARRLILLPFKNVVPEADRDPALGQKLEAEAAGILNLLLEGLRDYLRNGLAVPEELKIETAAFVASSDMMASFLEDETEVAEGGTVGAKPLYDRYKFFCGASGIRNLSMPQFRRELLQKGYATSRTKAGQNWVGLRLRRLHTYG